MWEGYKGAGGIKVTKLADFIRERYASIIISTLIIGILIGVFTPSPGLYIQRFTIPLVILMIGAMGFTITFKSFGTALKDVKSFLFGLFLNFVLAPALCWILALLLLRNQPQIATGLILIGVVPCAGMAIVWAGLLKGDVPLAVVINAGTMILAPFLIPLLMALLAGSYVQINILTMFYQLIYSVLFPVLGGMVLRKGYEQLGDVKKILPICPAISAVTAVFLMFMIINTSVAPIMRNVGLIFLLVISTILVFPIMFVVAFWISKRLFPIPKNIAITYSSGMKNLPIAIGIAVMSFKGMVALPIAVGAAFQMLTAASFYRFFQRNFSKK